MAIPDEPIRGSYAYLEHPGLLSLSGLEQFRVFMKRRVPFAPLFHLCGGVFSEAALGTATFTMPATPWWQSSAGVFFGGTYAFVADAALGGAIYTSFPKATVLLTSELSMSYLRPATIKSGTINARARVIQAGEAQGLSEAVVEDAQGRLLAHATSRCIIMRLPFDPPPPPEELPEFEEPEYPTPDPYLREADGALLPREEFDTKSGLQLAQEWCDGKQPNAPIAELMGWRCVEVEEGREVVAMPASEWFCGAGRNFYGGTLALLADGVMGAAVSTTLPPASSYASLDLKIYYLRPVQPDGRDLIARGEVIHRGRTVAVANVEITDADGKRVATATSSHLVFEGRSWIREGVSATLDEAPAEEQD
ncbi:MAG TPA: PaaI family thioesterase [Actinomycetota bacterium]|nr:PaaI family thioesterase [Actinomycetota bacterium]